MVSGRPGCLAVVVDSCLVDSHWRHPTHRSHLSLLLGLHLCLSLGHLLAKRRLSRHKISDRVIHLISELVYNEARGGKEEHVEDVPFLWCNNTGGKVLGSFPLKSTFPGWDARLRCCTFLSLLLFFSVYRSGAGVFSALSLS